MLSTRVKAKLASNASREAVHSGQTWGWRTPTYLWLLKISLEGSITRGSTIDKRFSENSFSSYPQMESQAILAKAKLLMVTILSQSSSIIRQLRPMLPGQVSVLEVILEEEEISCFDNILSAVTKMTETEKNLVQ